MILSRDTPIFPLNPVFPHSANELTLSWSGIHWSAPHKLSYTYFLQGKDRFWSPLVKDNKVSFTDLRPGEYIFYIKAVGGNGQWSETKSYAFTIVPPWWLRWWAYCFYGLIALGILYALREYEIKHYLTRMEARNLKKLDQVKNRLYTYISHEFRTPLTVIQGMNEKIAESPGNWSEEGTEMIRRNSRHLLHLVNQMLDLSKLESGNMELNLIQGNVVAYLQYLIQSFHSYTESKNIELVFYPELPELNMDYDEEKLRHVVSNLISNAIKFSPENSKIILHLKCERNESYEFFLLQVVDQGIGIARDKLPFVFNRFYQVENSSTRKLKKEGTGIGLTMTRELVKLMRGTIEVESQVHQGSTFSVRLPITREAPLLSEATQTETTDLPVPGKETQEDSLLLSNQELPSVLIIEDNPDVVRYLKSCLQDSYQLLTAENGAIGIQKALEHIPDLIISDVMMPRERWV